jgi:hypothetical protein
MDDACGAMGQLSDAENEAQSERNIAAKCVTIIFLISKNRSAKQRKSEANAVYAESRLHY